MAKRRVTYEVKLTHNLPEAFDDYIGRVIDGLIEKEDFFMESLWSELPDFVPEVSDAEYEEIEGIAEDLRIRKIRTSIVKVKEV